MSRQSGLVQKGENAGLVPEEIMLVPWAAEAVLPQAGSVGSSTSLE